MLLLNLTASGNFNPLYINTFNKPAENISLSPILSNNNSNKLLQDSIDTLIGGATSPTLQQKKNRLGRETIGKGTIDGYVQELENIYPYCKVLLLDTSQNMIIDSTCTDIEGYFKFENLLEHVTYVCIALDDDKIYRPIISKYKTTQ